MTPGAGAEQQFRNSFREEARELLVELESVLLELNERRDDGELVGRVFRGLHTIKGSGAMFGFEDLATFTHNLENAFDEVRKGRLEVTPALVDLTLAALDQIRAMVEEGEGASAVDAAASTEILTRLRALTGIAEKAAHQPGLPVDEQPGAEATPAAGESGKDVRERAWRIHFAPGPDLMRNGADPLLLVRELGEMGRLTAEASMAGIPLLEALEPERCYVSWEMVLTTEASEDRIRDVFIFVEDCCELTMTALAAEPTAGIPTVDHPAIAEKTDAPDAACAGDRIAKALEEKRASPGRRTTDLPENATSLRVPAARLDQLVDLVGELVTVQARLSEIAARSRGWRGAGGVRGDRAADVGAARELDDPAHAADPGDLRALPAAGARSGARPGQERGADHRGRGHGAGQDGDRSAGRSADAPDPQQHGSRHRNAGGSARRQGKRPTGDDSSVGAALRAPAC